MPNRQPKNYCLKCGIKIIVSPDNSRPYSYVLSGRLAGYVCVDCDDEDEMNV